MPAPYTIEESAGASGLSVKFIRRMKLSLPQLFEKHMERGPANALLFDEAMVEILKRTRELRSRGRTLQQIRDELSALGNTKSASEQPAATLAQPTSVPRELAVEDPWKAALERENALLLSQIGLLQGLLQKAEERFDRLLPAPKEQTVKSQLLLWLVEAVVVTAFAAGFIFMIWFFAQKAFQA